MATTTASREAASTATSGGSRGAGAVTTVACSRMGADRWRRRVVAGSRRGSWQDGALRTLLVHMGRGSSNS
jgi:hypothetical protein